MRIKGTIEDVSAVVEAFLIESELAFSKEGGAVFSLDGDIVGYAPYPEKGPNASCLVYKKLAEFRLVQCGDGSSELIQRCLASSYERSFPEICENLQAYLAKMGYIGRDGFTIETDNNDPRRKGRGLPSDEWAERIVKFLKAKGLCEREDGLTQKEAIEAVGWTWGGTLACKVKLCFAQAKDKYENLKTHDPDGILNKVEELRGKEN